MANKGLRSLVLLGTALLVGLAGPALAQSTADNSKPADQQSTAEANKSEAAHIADVARTVSGPAANPECVHFGELAITLMIKNDLDTAQRHINLYDRFGCPGLHLRLSFRCLINVGGIPGKDEKTTLDARVRECWINPNMVASVPSAPAPAASSPAAPAAAAPAATAGTAGH